LAGPWDGAGTRDQWRNGGRRDIAGGQREYECWDEFVAFGSAEFACPSCHGGETEFWLWIAPDVGFCTGTRGIEELMMLVFVRYVVGWWI